VQPFALQIMQCDLPFQQFKLASLTPSEAFGFSRNTKTMSGPPKVKVAAFALAGAGKQTVKMKYMF
jgi:uncharacterized protein (DUF2141 family)